jgi:hypothetical protein
MNEQVCVTRCTENKMQDIHGKPQKGLPRFSRIVFRKAKLRLETVWKRQPNKAV